MLVLHSGSFFTKLGYAGDDAPSEYMRTVVGKGTGRKYFSFSAIDRRLHVSLVFPVNCGVIQEFEEMEALWREIIMNNIRTDPTEYSIILTEQILNPKGNRIRMAEIMLDLGFKEVAIINTATLSLFSGNRHSGIVIDIGTDELRVTCILDSKSVPSSVQVSKIGGEHITSFAVETFKNKGFKFITISDRDIVRFVKEKEFAVAPDTSFFSNPVSEVQYELPDGTYLPLGIERYSCCEILFTPELFKDTANCKPVDVCVLDSLSQFSNSEQRELLENIVLEGGTCLLPGFKERLLDELRCHLPGSQKVNIVSSDYTKEAAWIGGSIVGALKPNSLWLSQEEFKRRGAEAINDESRIL